MRRSNIAARVQGTRADEGVRPKDYFGAARPAGPALDTPIEVMPSFLAGESGRRRKS